MGLISYDEFSPQCKGQCPLGSHPQQCSGNLVKNQSQQHARHESFPVYLQPREEGLTVTWLLQSAMKADTIMKRCQSSGHKLDGRSKAILQWVGSLPYMQPTQVISYTYYIPNKPEVISKLKTSSEYYWMCPPKN